MRTQRPRVPPGAEPTCSGQPTHRGGRCGPRGITLREEWRGLGDSSRRDVAGGGIDLGEEATDVLACSSKGRSRSRAHAGKPRQPGLCPPHPVVAGPPPPVRAHGEAPPRRRAGSREGRRQRRRAEPDPVWASESPPSLWRARPQSPSSTSPRRTAPGVPAWPTEVRPLRCGIPRSTSGGRVAATMSGLTRVAAAAAAPCPSASSCSEWCRPRDVAGQRRVRRPDIRLPRRRSASATVCPTSGRRPIATTEPPGHRGRRHARGRASVDAVDGGA